MIRGKRNVRRVTEFSRCPLNDAALLVAQKLSGDTRQVPTLSKIDELIPLALPLIRKPLAAVKSAEKKLTSVQAKRDAAPLRVSVSGDNFVRMAEPFVRRGIRVAPADVPRKKWRIWKPLQCATTNIQTLHSWGARMPDAGVGVLTGSRLPNGRFLVVIDKDIHTTFSDGFKTFTRCQQELGATPITFTVTTGGGGEQEYFSTTKSISSNEALLGPGLDVKGSGSLAIGAGIHSSGKSYQILRDVPIAELPEAWERSLTTKPQPKRIIPEGDRHNYLRRVSYAMACQRKEVDEIVRTLRQRAQFNCEKGDRLIDDQELLSLATSAIAKVAKADRILEVIVA